MSELIYSLYIEIRAENLFTNNLNLNLLISDILAGVSKMNWLALAFLIFHSMTELDRKRKSQRTCPGAGQSPVPNSMKL